ncbi:hypothetical protein GCM10011391_29130 [Pullulanibacillus camelliae]|uniref:DUF1805 domain-containing protein n=1 Tax=Pullulanibacillus camelliae TaxID=1707096 RepID=A0A8J2YKC6_9BACL|nr:DUF1805 domain-containing protein [Pullulanibacillus camelliae]GGE48488.1 hypothetical protein GCM10011391_29130 [Pullulanibacillus camelliae]
MVELQPMYIDGKPFTAVTVQLPKTNLMAVYSDKGYIMCGALDIAFFNEKLADRGIIAGKAVGVRIIDQLLSAPLDSVTLAAEKCGIKAGMIGRDALLKMSD